MPESRTGRTLGSPSASSWAPFISSRPRKKEEVLIRPLPKFLLDLSLDSQLPEFRLHLSVSVGRLGWNSQQTVGLPWVNTALEQLSLSERAHSPIRYSSAQLDSQPTSSSLPPDSFFVLTFFCLSHKNAATPSRTTNIRCRQGLL